MITAAGKTLEGLAKDFGAQQGLQLSLCHSLCFLIGMLISWGAGPARTVGAGADFVMVMFPQIFVYQMMPWI